MLKNIACLLRTGIDAILTWELKATKRNRMLRACIRKRTEKILDP